MNELFAPRGLVAKALGISPSAMTQSCKRHEIRTNKQNEISVQHFLSCVDGNYTEEQCLAAIELARTGDATAVATIMDARRGGFEALERKRNADAERAEIELERLREELISREDVLAASSDVMAAIRSGFRDMAQSLAPRIYKAATAAECQSIMEAEISERLGLISGVSSQ